MNQPQPQNPIPTPAYTIIISPDVTPPTSPQHATPLSTPQIPEQQTFEQTETAEPFVPHDISEPPICVNQPEPEPTNTPKTNSF